MWSSYAGAFECFDGASPAPSPQASAVPTAAPTAAASAVPTAAPTAAASAVPTAPTLDITSLTSFDDLQGLDLGSKSAVNSLSELLKNNEFKVSQFDAFLAATADDHMRVTHAIKDNKEIESINTYVQTLQIDENARLVKLNDKFSNSVLTVKQMYMMMNRDAHHIQSNIRLILYGMVAACCVMALMPMVSSVYAQAGIGLVIVAYFTFLVLYVRNQRTRRFTDFDKFFFPRGDLVESSAKEKDGKNDEDGSGECSSA